MPKKPNLPKIATSWFITGLKGAWGGKGAGYVYSTVKKTVLKLRKRKSDGGPAVLYWPFYWCQLIQYPLDQQWNNLSTWQKSLWQQQAKDSSPHSRSGLDYFRHVNIYRLMVQMRPMDQPPERPASRKTRLERSLTYPDIPDGKQVPVWTEGRTKPFAPYSPFNDTWWEPYPPFDPPAPYTPCPQPPPAPVIPSCATVPGPPDSEDCYPLCIPMSICQGILNPELMPLNYRFGFAWPPPDLPAHYWGNAWLRPIGPPFSTLYYLLKCKPGPPLAPDWSTWEIRLWTINPMLGIPDGKIDATYFATQHKDCPHFGRYDRIKDTGFCPSPGYVMIGPCGIVEPSFCIPCPNTYHAHVANVYCWESVYCVPPKGLLAGPPLWLHGIKCTDLNNTWILPRTQPNQCTWHYAGERLFIVLLYSEGKWRIRIEAYEWPFDARMPRFGWPQPEKVCALWSAPNVNGCPPLDTWSFDGGCCHPQSTVYLTEH